VKDQVNPAHLTQERLSNMRQAPRCGAKTRAGTPCRSPAVRGRRRCRMHGGAKGSGGPEGKANGNYRHGRYTREHVTSMQLFRMCARGVRRWLKDVQDH
jgi:hypothetical protein